MSETYNRVMLISDDEMSLILARRDYGSAVLPLPSAEVRAAIDFAADGIGLDLEDPDTLPAYRVLAERHSAVLRAYLAALEDAE